MSKTEETEIGDMVVIVMGAIFLTVAAIGIIGLVFTVLFNNYFIPVFMEHRRPISPNEGIGLFLMLWLTTVALRGRNTVKAK